MTPARLMPMADFVREVQRRCHGALDAIEMGHFLTVTRIEPASLDGFVHFASGRYTRHLVYKDHDVELLVLCWARGALAPIHGHEGEYCWARVERGQLRFRNYREISRAPLELKALGDVVDGGPGHVDGPADIHSVSNPVALGQDAVSVHVYCRPYDECDLYDVEEGTVRRVRLAYDSVPPRSPGSLGVESRAEVLVSDQPATRRCLLGALVLAPLIGGRAYAETAPSRLAQPSTPSRAAFLARARELRDAAVSAGDQPYGAILVRQGLIVGEGRSQVVGLVDPTAHSELMAVRDAARRLGTRDLSDCDLYSSAMPCPMCQGALYWAGVRRIHTDGTPDPGIVPKLGC